MKKNKYFFYMVRCADGSLYSGITTELERRVTEHNSSIKGAKYTRIKRPVTLVYSERFPTRSEAQKREYQVKSYSKKQKEQLIHAQV